MNGLIIPIDNDAEMLQQFGDDDAEPEMTETISIGSSIEIRDAAINESWDWTSVQRRLRHGPSNNSNKGRASKMKSSRIQNIDTVVNELGVAKRLEKAAKQKQTESNGNGWLSGIWRWWNEQTINGRLMKYDEDEREEFIGQRLNRIIGIYLDEKTKSELSKLILTNRIQELIQREDPLAQALRRKYGQRMAEWIALYAQQVEQHRNGKKKKKEKKFIGIGLSKAEEAAMKMKNSALEKAIEADVDDRLVGNALNDPLMGWFRQKQDVTGRMLARIQNLAASISQQVAWSFLIEPGRPRTDLSRFYAEFDVLENFFDKVELTAEECSQKAFDANCLFKVRNRKLVCVDWSRIRLKAQSEIAKENQQTIRHYKTDIFAEDFHYPPSKGRTEFSNGTDFINASRVVGGPLLNEFILTQAPLSQTMSDFWRMVWQERSEWIFQLCESTIDPAENGGILANGSILDQLCRTHCPYYWPRFEGEILQFGRLFVRNVGIDMASDPLFTITHLVVWMDDENENGEEDIAGPSNQSTTNKNTGGMGKLRLQHWQWDWRTYTDFHWPFRLLLRSRHSKQPTILMCADGCGRSGTLALIEIFLMQLLRGAVSIENPMLTAAVFLRLQRRHAVANHMQWLFAYRTVLHWLQPFVISFYHRLVLGFAFPNHGFYAKYAEIAHSYAHQKSLHI